MPPRAKVSKQEIVSAALDVIRQGGEDALNARSVSAKLGCSTQPIFSHYASMEQLKADVTQAVWKIYHAYLRQEMTSGDYPPYKASGMGYIRFAKEEKALFRMLFMCDRTGQPLDNADDISELIAIIQKNTGLSEQDARLFHIEMWIFVHGIATMLATSYLDWKWEDIDRFMSDAYLGVRSRFIKQRRGESTDGCDRG